MKGVILLAPPWPGGGTANIVAAQIAVYRGMGFNVYLLLEPFGIGNSAYSDKWKKIAQSMPFAGEVPIDYPAAPSSFLNRVFCRFSKKFDDTITEVANCAASGCLPSSLTNFIQEHELEHIRVNHVFGMKLAKRVLKAIISKTGRTVPTVLDTHDIQSDNYAFAKHKNPISKRTDTKEKMLAGELSLANDAETLIHISRSDYDFFVSALPDRRHFYIPPTLNPEIERELTLHRQDDSAPELDFVYFGVNHAGNLSSVRWLLADVFPHFRGDIPNVKIVGTIKHLFEQKEPGLFRQYANLFTGEVPVTLPWYKKAKGVLAHSTAGTGASIKLIEALCAGKITITNSIGTRGGLSLDHSDDLVVTDDPAAFATAMRAIASATKRYSSANADIYEKSFSNTVYRETMRSVLQPER